jgi:dipeptidyl aminopeptidase/acylaminoacyl peptidase
MENSLKSTKLNYVSPEDHFQLRTLIDAKLSPDGKYVVYVVNQTEKIGQKEEDVSAIYLIDLENKISRRLTSELARESSPDWSPDSKRIAFLSDRSGKSQVYTMVVDGGETVRLTSMDQGVEGSPIWSPDGMLIAFTASQTRSIQYLRPNRITRPIYKMDGTGYVEDAIQDIYVVPASGGKPQRLVHNLSVNRSLQWSPDGKEILFLVGFEQNAQNFGFELGITDLDGNNYKILKGWGDISYATWTKDGKKIVILGIPSDRLWGMKADLWVLDRGGGELVCRTRDMPYHIADSMQPDVPTTILERMQIVIEDNFHAFIPVHERATMKIYRVALAGVEKWVPVITGERNSLPLSYFEETLLFAASHLRNPVDLFLANKNGSKEHQITFLNSRLQAMFDLPEIETLTITAVDGELVEGWYIKPTSGKPPYPTVLCIHGGPCSGFGHIFSFDFHMLAGAGFGVLIVNERGSTGYGEKFATTIFGDLGNLDYQDLMSGVDYAVLKGLADPDRLGVYGLSAGGNLTCWIIGHTDRFKAAVAENPITNWLSLFGTSDIGIRLVPLYLKGMPYEIPDTYYRCSPIAYAHQCKTPTLLIQGEFDFRCPAEQSEQFYAVLKAIGCMVEMLRLPGASHMGSVIGSPQTRRAQNEALLDWMTRFLLA